MLGLHILAFIILGLLFAFPLKVLCNLCGAPYFILLGLSGLISYVNAIAYQSLKGRNKDLNIFEFIYIFSLNISFIFLGSILGYPIIAYLFSTCDMLPIMWLKDTFYLSFSGIFAEPFTMTNGEPGGSGIPVANSSSNPGTQVSGVPVTSSSSNPSTQGSGIPVASSSGNPGTQVNSVPVANGNPATQTGGNSIVNQPIGNNSNVNQPGGNQVGGVAAAANQGFVFDAVKNQYIISDPTGVRNRGYLNPVTGQEYPSYQPYLRNFANALNHSLRDPDYPNRRSGQFGTHIFTEQDHLFWKEFMAHEYPNRIPGQYWNSVPVRNRMSRKP